VRLPKRPCKTVGCPFFAVAGGRCTACVRLANIGRGSPSRRGYDEKHRTLRVLAFQRDKWRCIECGWEPDTVRDSRAYGLGEPPTDAILEELRLRRLRNDRHLHGDHEASIATRPDLRHDLDNYRTLCNTCHSAKTLREQRGSVVVA
jgi:5-methylcytosine-specific restriction endonuclease McrA